MASYAQPAYGGTLLRQGSDGPDVALVQQWLNEAQKRYPELPKLTVDGRFGPDTAKAVRMFQKLAGLSADGIVGPDTWDALYDGYAAVHGGGEIWPGISLRAGDTGATVRSAQQKLRFLVPWLAADGRYGPDTKEAVTAYQVTKDLKPDGILGYNTWYSLYGA